MSKKTTESDATASTGAGYGRANDSPIVLPSIPSVTSSGDTDTRNPESKTLRSILGDTGDGKAIEEFFQSVWQECCGLFSLRTSSNRQSNNNDNIWNDERMKEAPVEEIVENGWTVLEQLMTVTNQRLRDSSNNDNGTDAETNVQCAPLFFKHQSNVTQDYRDVFSAYLDGCSVVLNHSDRASPWLAALCNDLQLSFPHAYSNSYITPPNSQAVPAHADDRDVLIIQVVGSKHWKVYKRVPIPYPYPDEQVGKEGLEVPAEVLNGPLAMETTLAAGMVLYMPRGYVHEARCSDDLSFHVTVALATHDWTLAGIMSSAASRIWSSCVPYRKAIPRSFGRQSLNEIPRQDKDELQRQIGEALQMMMSQVTVSSVANHMEEKFYKHNHRAFAARMKLIHDMRFAVRPSIPNAVVGEEAANLVTFYHTTIRAATSAEKASVVTTQPRGLQVREDVADAIIFILQAIKGQPAMSLSVSALQSLCDESAVPNLHLVDRLTLLCFVKSCVRQGALAIVS